MRIRVRVLLLCYSRNAKFRWQSRTV